MNRDITHLPLLPALLLCLLLAAASVWGYTSGYYADTTAEGLMPLGIGLMEYIGDGVGGGILYALLSFINATTIMRLMTSNMLVMSRTYLTMPVFMAVSCCIYAVPAGTITSLAATLLLAAIHCLVRGFRRRPSIDLYFRGALLIGTIPLLWAPGALYAAALPVAVRLFRRSSREMTVATAGFLLPMATYCYIVWARGGDFLFPVYEWWHAMTAQTGPWFLLADTGVVRIAIYTLLALLAVCSAWSFAASGGNMRTRQIRVYTFVVFLFLISAATALLPSFSPAAFPVMAVPATAMMQSFFGGRSVWTRRAVALLYMALLAAAILNCITPGL